VRYEVDYDDVTLLVTALRCINNSDQGPTGAVVGAGVARERSEPRVPARLGHGPDEGSHHPAGVTESVSVPTNQASRLQLIVTLRRGSPTVSNLDGEFMARGLR
jgi:hypothetical protein